MSQIKPRVESLEDRTVPAVQMTQSGNVLRIFGSPQADGVRIVDQGFGNLQVFDAPNPAPRFFFGVTGVTAVLGGGNDSLRYDLTSTAGSPLRITALMGFGADTFRAFFNRNRVAANRVIDINGQAGSDVLSCNALGGVSVVLGVLVNVQLYGRSRPCIAVAGADGGDNIAYDYRGVLGGSMIYFGDGGVNGGNDVITGNIALETGSAGSLVARVRGREGNDRLRLVVALLGSPITTTVNAALDGGPGVDTAGTSSNVARVNIP
jgi:hypothetical protein